VDDNKIASLNVGKLTAGELNVGSFIQSTNYVAGTQGWKIHGNGFAEFGAADIRGQLTAAQIDSRGLTIRTAAGAVILNAGTSEFSGNVAGTVAGTDASTLVTTANDAATAADAAQTAASNALTGLTTKLNSNARNVLAGEGGLAVGTLTWNSSGVRTGGYGVGFSANGLAAYNSAGAATFVLDGSTGNATFAGALSAATGSFAGSLSAATGTFSGGLLAATGTFSGSLTAQAINAVDTLNVAGNAISSVVTASAGNSVSVQITVPDVAAGQPVLLLGNSLASINYGATHRFLRNGLIIFSRGIIMSNAGVVFVIDTPGAGVFTYTYSQDNNNVSANLTIVAQLIKR
jgi:hypothetical protein